MTSFVDVNVIILSITLGLSLSLKVRDWPSVIRWLHRRLPLSVSWLAYAIIVLAEAAVLFALNSYGPFSAVMTLGVSAALLLLGLLSGAVFKNSSCPCFGSVFMGSEKGMLKLLACVFAATALVYTVGSRFEIDLRLWNFSLTIVGVMVFFLGQRSISSTLHGSLIKVDGSVGGSVSNRAIIIAFLSSTCPVCMDFKKFLELQAGSLNDVVDMYLVLDQQLSSVGHTRDLGYSGEDGHLKEMFKIKSTPSIVVSTDKGWMRYSGINACNAGLYAAVSFAMQVSKSEASPQPIGMSFVQSA